MSFVVLNDDLCVICCIEQEAFERGASSVSWVSTSRCGVSSSTVNNVAHKRHNGPGPAATSSRAHNGPGPVQWNKVSFIGTTVVHVKRETHLRHIKCVLLLCGELAEASYMFHTVIHDERGMCTTDADSRDSACLCRACPRLLPLCISIILFSPLCIPICNFMHVVLKYI